MKTMKTKSKRITKRQRIFDEIEKTLKKTPSPYYLMSELIYPSIVYNQNKKHHLTYERQLIFSKMTEKNYEYTKISELKNSDLFFSDEIKHINGNKGVFYNSDPVFERFYKIKKITKIKRG